MEEVDWWDDAGQDLYSLAAADQVRAPPRPFDPELYQVSHRCPSLPLDAQEDGAAKIKSLVETPALDWNSHRPERRSRTSAAAAGVPSLKKPLPSRRCNEPGHFIQHCLTNGDTMYDVKKVCAPAGIPKSMLIALSDGSLVLPSGDVAVLKPNEAAFEKAMERLPSSTRTAIREIPPDMRCPLCGDMMKDAVMTIKCCFASYCDHCIRGYMISKSKCVCGAADVLAEYLIPIVTLRGVIKRILESSSSSLKTSSSKNGISSVQSAALSDTWQNDKKSSSDDGSTNTSTDDVGAMVAEAAEKRIGWYDDGEQAKKSKKIKKDLAGGGAETQWGCDYNAANYMIHFANAMQRGTNYNGYMMAEQQHMMSAYIGYGYNAAAAATCGVPTHYVPPPLLPDLSELIAPTSGKSKPWRKARYDDQ